MVLKSLFTLGFCVGAFTGLQAAEEMTAAPKALSTASGNLKTLELLGKMISSDPFSRFKLNQEEQKALVDGFQTGLVKPLSREEMMAQGMGVRLYMQGKMDELQKEDQTKLQENMAKVKFPMDHKIRSSQGKEVTLGELVKGKKAVFLDFWASWCGPCMQLMPSLIEKNKILSPLGIVVVGMNTESDAAKAEEVRLDQKIDFLWLVEPENGPFSELLGIDTVPRIILVSENGSILFNGHPKDDALNTALEKLGVSQTR